jgi:hypothetical protein
VIFLQVRPAKKAKTGYSGLEAPFPAWRTVFQRKSFDFRWATYLKSSVSPPIPTQQHKMELL